MSGRTHDDISRLNRAFPFPTQKGNLQRVNGRSRARHRIDSHKVSVARRAPSISTYRMGDPGEVLSLGFKGPEGVVVAVSKRVDL